METRDVARRLYAAVADPSLLPAVLAPDVVLHDPGDHPLGGDHRGIAGVRHFLTVSGGVGASTEVLDVMGGDTFATAYCRVRADRDGTRLDNHTVHLFRITGGRIAEAWFHNRDQAHVDRFWNAVLPARAGAA